MIWDHIWRAAGLIAIWVMAIDTWRLHRKMRRMVKVARGGLEAARAEMAERVGLSPLQMQIAEDAAQTAYDLRLSELLRGQTK